MDASHLHLISNHFPIIGVLCGLLVMAYGMARQSPPTLASAYMLFIVSALVGLVAYFTGEGAEHVAEKLPGVTHDSIELHEEAATYALITYVILFLFSVFGFFKSKNHYNRIRKLALIILVIALLTAAAGAVTGFLGGQIRHTELRTTGI